MFTQIVFLTLAMYYMSGVGSPKHTGIKKLVWLCMSVLFVTVFVNTLG